MKYHFGRFELDTKRYQLRREGEEIRLEPRVFDLLAYLVEHQDRVVSKDELVEEVWSRAFITDSTLKRAIHEARRALDDDGTQQRCIRTIYGRGYRFVLRLTAPVPAEAREPAAAAGHVFVAREKELEKLDRLLGEARAGQGRVAFITGEAGTGKTMLWRALARRAVEADPELIVAAGLCDSHIGPGDPFLPFREVLSRLAGGDPGGLDREQIRRSRALLPSTVTALLRHGPDLIGTFEPATALVSRAEAFAEGEVLWLAGLKRLIDQKAAVPAHELRTAVVREQYTRVLQALARHRPLMVVLDDLHAADSGSVDLLLHLGRRIGADRIVVLGAYRPAEVALGRSGQRHPPESVVNELKARFGDREIALRQTGDRRFVEDLIDSEPNRLGAGFRRRLYTKTGGHPLFTVELLRTMQQEETLARDGGGRWFESRALNWETLPARVEAVVAERVERLPARLRTALAVAAIEGEEFTAEVVARVQKLDSDEMIAMLSSELDRRHRLVSAQGVRWAGDQRLSRYRFRHILFQKYVYSRLDEVERSHLHEAVGTALETLHRERLEPVAVHLARHFDDAGIPAKAVEHLYQAGLRAVRLSASEEAIAHLSRGLARLETLPATVGRDRLELAFQLALGSPFQASRSPGAPELGRACARARELCHQIGDMERLAQTLFVLVTFHGTRAEYRAAVETGEELLRVAEHLDAQLYSTLAHSALGYVQLHLGSFAKARDHLRKVLAFYDPVQHRSLVFQVGLDLGVAALSWDSLALLYMGYPDRALKRSRQAEQLAREIDHPTTSALALGISTRFYRLRRDPETFRDHTARLTSIASLQGLPMFQTNAVYLEGYVEALAEEAAGGLEKLRRGLDGYRAIGCRLATTEALGNLAEALWKASRVEDGLNVLAEALETVRETGERFSLSELYRLRGELLLTRSGAEAVAEESFQKAIEVGRSQGARFLELRSIVSWSRAFGSRDRRQDARRALARIYDWFDEGFEVPDLKDAKALFDELT